MSEVEQLPQNENSTQKSINKADSSASQHWFSNLQTRRKALREAYPKETLT